MPQKKNYLLNAKRLDKLNIQHKDVLRIPKSFHDPQHAQTPEMDFKNRGEKFGGLCSTTEIPTPPALLECFPLATLLSAGDF